MWDVPPLGFTEHSTHPDTPLTILWGSPGTQKDGRDTASPSSRTETVESVSASKEQTLVSGSGSPSLARRQRLTHGYGWNVIYNYFFLIVDK